MAIKKTLSLTLIMLAILLGGMAYGQATKYEATIPPEILNRYDPGVVEGSRPKFVTITQPMIWGLRNNPNQGGEIYRLDLDAAKLSTVQKEILQDWVKGGQKILIWGRDELFRYSDLFSGLGSAFDDFNQVPNVQLSNHPVNTDVRDIDFSDGDSGKNIDYAVFRKYPVNSEIIVSVKEGLIAGVAPFGRGSIYFASPWNGWKRGADRDRWTLNFYQSMLGLRVPGSAGTRVGAGSSNLKAVKKEVYDRVLLKNGDTVSGKLVTDKFSVKTSYALLSFELKQIESVVLEGSGQNIEMIVLRNGDKLSGIVGPDAITIKLVSGQQTEIEKDKIKEISVQQ